MPYDDSTGPESGNTTYGGIIAALAAYYDSSVTLNLNNQENTTELKVNGFYAEQLDTFADLQTLQYRCNISFLYFGEKIAAEVTAYSAPSDDLQDQIRNTLFYTSIWSMEDNPYILVWDSEVENQPDAQISYGDIEQLKISKYHVIWPWYFGSLAITLSIVLFILPTFYGFWTLARKTTLSPFETARAVRILEPPP